MRSEGIRIGELWILRNLANKYFFIGMCEKNIKKIINVSKILLKTISINPYIVYA
jgi:hypothetical protein